MQASTVSLESAVLIYSSKGACLQLAGKMPVYRFILLFFSLFSRGAGRLIVGGYAISLTLRRLGTLRGFTIHGLTHFWVLATDFRL